MIEIRVIGDDAEAIKRDIALLAETFGVTTGDVTIETKSEDTLVGTATGEAPKKRGRKSNAEKAAEALDAPQEPPPAAEDPFGADEEEETVDLEALKKSTLERLQKLSGEKGGMDTVNSLLAKHGKGEKKFSKIPADVFPAIAKDLDVLNA